MLHRYGCIGCILNADIRSTRGFTTDVIIPKYKFGCIQYRWTYNILEGFITMCFADIFANKGEAYMKRVRDKINIYVLQWHCSTCSSEGHLTKVCEISGGIWGPTWTLPKKRRWESTATWLNLCAQFYGWREQLWKRQSGGNGKTVPWDFRMIWHDAISNETVGSP